MATAPVYNPFFDHEHVSPLTGVYPFTDIDRACIYGPAAALRTGRQLLGYTDGDTCEKLIAVDGKWAADPVRPYFRLHDPLPLISVWADRLSNGVLDEAVCRAIADNTASNMSGPNFAHKGTRPGWDGRAEGGIIGHWCHSENLLHHYLRRFDGESRFRWGQWVDSVSRMLPFVLKLGHGRETHTHLLRMYLANKQYPGLWAIEYTTKLAEFLISKPLREHSVTVYDGNYFYAVWKLLGERAHEWLLQADDDCWTCEEIVPLTLAAIAYWIDRNPNRLRRHLPTLLKFPGFYYRTASPADPLDYIGVAIGRTGDNGIPTQWPIFRKALLGDGGLRHLDIFSAINTSGCYPLSTQGGVVIRGANLTTGTIATQSYGGDANGVRIYARRDGADTDRFIWLPKQSYQWKWSQRYAFTDILWGAVNEVRIQCDSWGQIGAPISDLPGEHAVIDAGKPYYLSSARGMLKTSGPVRFEILQDHMTIYGQALRRPMFHGMDAPFTININQAALFRFAGPRYAKLQFTCSQPGTWWPSLR